MEESKWWNERWPLGHVCLRETKKLKMACVTKLLCASDCVFNLCLKPGSRHQVTKRIVSLLARHNSEPTGCNYSSISTCVKQN